MTIAVLVLLFCSVSIAVALKRVARADRERAEREARAKRLADSARRWPR